MTGFSLPCQAFLNPLVGSISYRVAVMIFGTLVALVPRLAQGDGHAACAGSTNGSDRACAQGRD